MLEVKDSMWDRVEGTGSHPPGQSVTYFRGGHSEAGSLIWRRRECKMYIYI